MPPKAKTEPKAEAREPAAKPAEPKAETKSTSERRAPARRMWAPWFQTRDER